MPKRLKPSPFPPEVLDQLLTGSLSAEEMFGSDGLLVLTFSP